MGIRLLARSIPRQQPGKHRDISFETIDHAARYLLKRLDLDAGELPRSVGL